TVSTAPPRPAQAALSTNAIVCRRATRSPHRDAAISSSRTARIARPKPPLTTFLITNSTTSAPAHAIHASQRSRGKLAPSPDGGVGGLMVSPFSPPNVPLYLSASAGRPTANARVTPARYGPRSLVAAAPRS